MATLRPPTRERILDAAVELFAARGFHETSMRDLASAVGIRAASLYAHFPGKEAILRAILADYQREIAALRRSDGDLERLVRDHTPRELFVGGFRAIQAGVSGARARSTMRILFQEMFRDPEVGRFALDTLRNRNLAELARTFAAMRRHGKLGQADPGFAAVLFNGLVSSHFQTLFACGADSAAARDLEQATVRQLENLSDLLTGRPAVPVTLEAPHAEGAETDRLPGR